MATLTELTDYLRRRLDDEAANPLWSDEELISYLNDAEREACIRARLLKDRTTAGIAIYDVISGSPWIDLSPLVIQVETKARLTGKDIVQVSEDSLLSNWQDQSAKPDGFFVDSGRLCLVPNPIEDDVLSLIVSRLPMKDMAQEEDVPEIPAIHHYRLIDWAARCAYLKRDSDAHDEKLAEKHDALFTRSFGAAVDANVRTKLNHRRSDKVRFEKF